MSLSVRQLRNRATSLAVGAACLSTVAIGLAPSAQAANIDKWSSFWQPCGTYMCLYYHQGLTGASWTPTWSSDTDLGGNKFGDHGTGSDGAGQVVRNNAASMGNNTTNCRVATFVYTDFQGDNNWLTAGHAGNLNSSLSNNEASIRVDTCT
ncbi:hypothetical protein ACWERI_12880 [Streptomyces collinus]|uniref:hypothetical protein n=1 Tax=Streptomyces collinus TaxID=42684 RepID=UPI0036C4600B